MADNVAITPGSGSTIATDDVGGVQFQKMKLDIGADGVSVPATGDGTYGLDVDVTRVSGVVQVGDNSSTLSIDDGGGNISIDDGGNSITIDAAALPLPTGAATETTLAGIKTGTDKIPASPATDRATAGAPFSARLSDGTNFYDGAKTGQLPSALVGGRLDVNIGASAAVPVTDNSGSLTIDAPVGTPAFVRLSDGASPITALPVTDNAGSLTVDAPVGTPVFVRLSDGASAITALPITDNSGSLTVDGTVTANQGTAAASSGAWPTKISDGTDTVGISTVSAAKALKVDVVQSVTHGQADKSSFTEGTTIMTPAGGVYNDTISSDPSEDQAAALRITAKRGLHVNLRSAAGVEQGTNAAPVQVGDASGSLTVDAPVGTPVFVRLSDGAAAITNLASNLAQVGGNAVATAASGIAKVGLTDEAGAAFSDTNPLQVTHSGMLNRTIRRAAVTYSASQTDQAIITPSGGTRLVVESLILKVSAAGVLQIFADSNSSANMILEGNFAVDDLIQLTFPNGHPLDAINEVLRYTTGAGAAGRITAFAYEV